MDPKRGLTSFTDLRFCFPIMWACVMFFTITNHWKFLVLETLDAMLDPQMLIWHLDVTCII